MDTANKTMVAIEFNPETDVSAEFLNNSLLGVAARGGDISDLTFYEGDSQMPSFSVDGSLSIKDIFTRFIKPFAAVIDGTLVTMADGKEYLITWYANKQENTNQPQLV